MAEFHDCPLGADERMPDFDPVLGEFLCRYCGAIVRCRCGEKSQYGIRWHPRLKEAKRKFQEWARERAIEHHLVRDVLALDDASRMMYESGERPYVRFKSYGGSTKWAASRVLAPTGQVLDYSPDDYPGPDHIIDRHPRSRCGSVCKALDMSPLETLRVDNIIMQWQERIETSNGFVPCKAGVYVAAAAWAYKKMRAGEGREIIDPADACAMAGYFDVADAVLMWEIAEDMMLEVCYSSFLAGLD
jgi:hypothetical protein